MPLPQQKKFSAYLVNEDGNTKRHLGDLDARTLLAAYRQAYDRFEWLETRTSHVVVEEAPTEERAAVA